MYIYKGIDEFSAKTNFCVHQTIISHNTCKKHMCRIVPISKTPLFFLVKALPLTGSWRDKSWVKENEHLKQVYDLYKVTHLVLVLFYKATMTINIELTSEFPLCYQVSIIRGEFYKAPTMEGSKKELDPLCIYCRQPLK